MEIDKAQVKALADRVMTDRSFCGDEAHRNLAAAYLEQLVENEKLRTRMGESHQAHQKARTLILESAATCKLPVTDPGSVSDASSAFDFCNGYIRCADDMDLLTDVESRQLRELLRNHHPA